jgi:hypothetical protein
MGTVPRDIAAKIEWFATHQPIWLTNTAAIGLAAGDAATLLTKVQAAQDARAAQVTAQNAAKSATVTLRSAIDDLSNYGAQLLAKIKTKALSTGDSVYALADVAPPAIPTPMPPPGACTDFVPELQADGSLKSTWTSNNPVGSSGTVYQLWRRVTADGAFEYVGGTGDKQFVDSTIPAGSSQVTYQIQAVRSTAVGPWAQFNVNFGTGGGSGTTTMSVTETKPTPKIAA